MNINDLSQEPSEVIVVEASAGSGKTYALAKRYLKLLINPVFRFEQIPLRSILAITFTNKATVEMKERILELLKRIAFDEFKNKEQEEDIYQSLELDKNFAKKRAKEIMDELIQNYSFFQVQTIDSFINALLLGCALRIDRSASFTIKRDYIPYLAYSLDLVIEQAPSNKTVLDFLKDFLQHYLFVENRSGWFPRQDIVLLLQSLFRLSNKYSGLFFEYEGEGKNVIRKKIALFEEIKELAKGFPDGMNKNAQNSIIKFIEDNDNIFEISEIPKKFQQPSVPMNKGKEGVPTFERKWEKIYHGIKELIELEATISYTPYINLFRGMLLFLKDISKREDVLFLEELNKKARSLFGDGGVTVAELYYRLATRFRHYLIDEFQDTSRIQWQNLKMMIEEALSTGGSLFYVGDKKQAIYRFRGGEAGLFDQVKEELSQYNVRIEHLTKNWRSQKAIVEFNNRVFSYKNLKKTLKDSGILEELTGDDSAEREILDVFKDAIQERKEENQYGYVRVLGIDEKNQEERDEIMQRKILSLIEDLKKRFNYEDIALLTRDNNEVEIITSWLLKAGYPVESEKTLNLLENALIKELLSFLKFLCSPIDDLSFAAFILSDLFCCVTALKQEEMRDFIFNLHQEKKLSPNISLYTLFREEYPEVWNAYIDEFFKSVGFISPYELTVSIYQRFQLMERMSLSQAFLMKFLELIKAREDEYVNLSDFLSYIKDAPPEDLYVNVIHSDSIKVHTIHKSKGLEFPVVILPFLRMDISPESGGRGTSSYVVDQGEDLGLVRITSHYRPYSEELQKIYSKACKKACIDELNNIYVALTRPKFELYLFVPKRSANKPNKARFLIPEEIREMGEKMVYEKKRRDKKPLMIIPPSSYRDWMGPLKEEFGDFDRIKNREKIFYGNVMHTILSLVGNLLSKREDEVIQRAISDAMVLYPAISDFTPYTQSIQSLISKKEIKPFFYVEDGEVFQEKEMVSSFGDLKRIDRLVVKEKEVWVVDYKSRGENEEIHQKQMREYMEIAEEIYPGREIKGFLIYFDEMSVKRIKK